MGVLRGVKRVALELLGECGMILRSLKRSPAKALAPRSGSAEIRTWVNLDSLVGFIRSLALVLNGGFRVPRRGNSVPSFLNLLADARV
jgi:hypothetical protein